MTTEVVFTLTVNLDPVPGAFNTVEDALTRIQQILNDRIAHYQPVLRTIDGCRAEKRDIELVPEEYDDYGIDYEDLHTDCYDSDNA